MSDGMEEKGRTDGRWTATDFELAREEGTETDLGRRRLTGQSRGSERERVIVKREEISGGDRNTRTSKGRRERERECNKLRPQGRENAAPVRSLSSTPDRRRGGGGMRRRGKGGKEAPFFFFRATMRLRGGLTMYDAR